MNDKQIEWLGTIFGLLGSYALATHSSWADIGFYLFLVSNVFFIAFTLRKKLYGILVMNLGFTCTSVLGIVNSEPVLNIALL